MDDARIDGATPPANAPAASAPPSAPAQTELPRWSRALVTASAPLWAWMLGSVAFASVDSELGELFHGEPTLELTVGALGLVVLFTASALVEVGSLVRAPWRAARLAGPDALAPRLRVAVLLAFLLAATQAWGFAQLLGHMASWSLAATATTALTLVAGFALSVAVAAGLGRWGLANGAFTLVGGGALVKLVRALAQSLQNVDELAWRPPVLLLGAAALSAVLVWLASRGAAEPASRPPSGTPYRDREQRPLAVEVSPAPGGLMPVLAVGSLAGLGPNLAGPSSGASLLDEPSRLGLAVVIALLFGADLARREQTARLWARAAGRPVDQEIARAARATTRAALARGVVFTAASAAIAIVGTEPVPVADPAVGVGIAVAVLTAVILDAARAFRARGAAITWRPAWTEPRPDAVPAALGALLRAGIPAHLVDATCGWLFPLVGPIAPTVVMVPADEVDRAREILAAVLPNEPVASGDLLEMPSPIAPRTGGALSPALVGMVAIAAVAFGLQRLERHRVELDGPPPAPATLQLRYVDDEIAATDPFRGVALPPGASAMVESVPIGGGRIVTAPYLRFVPVGGETVADVAPRARSWLATVGPPAGATFGIGPWEEIDDETGRSVQGGFRTYVFVGETIVTEDDLVDAMAVRDADPYSQGRSSVSIVLGPSAAERFSAATRKWLRRRLAIVVDDVVVSAPVIQGVITGGRVQITMGAGDPATQLAEAKRLEAALRGGRGAKPR